MYHSAEYRCKLEERFWSQVNKTATCWLWTGHTNRPEEGRRYGQIRVNGVILLVHRISYELAYGYFKPYLYVLHKCDVTLCVRPSHLFLGTQFTNMQDAVNKGHRRDYNKGKSRITTQQLTEIRDKRDKGYTLVKLGKEYGCSKSTIWNIIKKIGYE